MTLTNQETGLHYNYFRDYDPSTGRYVESDPIGLEGGLNTYGYVGGNPLIYFDPFGLMSNCAACILNCNIIFKWESKDRVDDFLMKDTECRVSKSSAFKGKAITCRIGNTGFDFGLKYYNKSKLNKCLNKCAETDCKEGESCK